MQPLFTRDILCDMVKEYFALPSYNISKAITPDTSFVGDLMISDITVLSDLLVYISEKIGINANLSDDVLSELGTVEDLYNAIRRG